MNPFLSQPFQALQQNSHTVTKHKTIQILLKHQLYLVFTPSFSPEASTMLVNSAASSAEPQARGLLTQRCHAQQPCLPAAAAPSITATRHPPSQPLIIAPEASQPPMTPHRPPTLQSPHHPSQPLTVTPHRPRLFKAPPWPLTPPPARRGAAHSASTPRTCPHRPGEGSACARLPAAPLAHARCGRSLPRSRRRRPDRRGGRRL